MEKNASAIEVFKKLGPQVAIWFLIAFLLSPFLLLYLQIGNLDFPASDELIWSLQNTTIQACGSAVFSVLFGIWGASGLLSLKKEKWRLFWEVIFLLPNFVPPLFVVLAILKTIEPFPIGLIGLIFVHSFINAGLVAVLLARIVDQKVGSLVELAMVEGAGRFQFAGVILRMLRLDLTLLFLLIFSICFMSFSVPLLVGGDQGATLEVLIFEKVRLSSQWNQALGISFLQCVFLFLFSLVTVQETKTVKKEKRNMSLLAGRSGLAGGVIIVFIFLFGMGRGLSAGVQQISQIGWTVGEIFDVTMASLILGLGVGGLCFLIFQVILLLLPSPLLQKFLRGYLAPSTALTGFAFLFLGPSGGWFIYIKLTLALVLISLPFLYRLGWEQEWLQVERQWQVAKSMGASQWQIYWDILLPQTSGMAGLLSGLAALWASGDFALSGMMVGQDFSLGLVVHSLMSFYRLNAASVLGLLLIGVGIVCFVFFWGVGHVLGQKSRS